MSAWFGRVGSKDALPDNKPSIWLVTDDSWSEEDTRAVAAGCEEEGVPLAWDIRSGPAEELARVACMRSHLEVGIGVDASRTGAIALVAVTDHPYVEKRAVTAQQLRWLGQTAARMSKGQPIVEETSPRAPGAREREGENGKSGSACSPIPPPSVPPGDSAAAAGGPRQVDESEIASIVDAVMRILRDMQEGGVDGR